MFLSTHLNTNILSLNTVSALWSWTIWIYIFFQLSVFAGSVGKHMSKINTLIIGFNYILLMVFFVLYIYGYGYGYKFDDKGYTILFISLLLIMIFVLSTRHLLKNIKYTDLSSVDKLNEEEIRAYVYAKLRRESLIHISMDRQERIAISTLNNLTIILLCIVPILGSIFNKVFNSFEIILFYLAFVSMCFLVLNRIKYKKCKISFPRFIFDVMTSILSFICYALFDYYDNGMFIFPKLFLTVYTMTPFLLSCEKIIKTYQFGEKGVSKIV